MSESTATLQIQDGDLAQEVERRSGTPASACYQCHKCSTGCPVAPDADYASSQIMRLIQMGQKEEVLSSRAIWLCASCEACTTRCPQNIDVAAVMDTLRIMAVEETADTPDARGKKFNYSFLDSVRRHGRVYELGMLTFYKLRMLDFFSDADKAPKMLAKGKLSLLPNRSGSAGEVKQVFKRAEEEEKKR